MQHRPARQSPSPPQRAPLEHVAQNPDWQHCPARQSRSSRQRGTLGQAPQVPALQHSSTRQSLAVRHWQGVQVCATQQAPARQSSWAQQFPLTHCLGEPLPLHAQRASATNV
jgi:hypothetical protein